MRRLQPSQIETERLSIRELEESDLDFVAEMLADPEVMRYWPSTCSREEAAEWIARHRRRYVDDGFGYWRMALKESGQPVGQVGLLRQDIEGQVATGLGYMVHRPYWRQGFAFEAATACLRYGLETLGVPRIAVLIRPENGPSLAVARKLGGRFEREIEYAGFCHQVYWIER